MKHGYTFLILRYRHDPLAGEAINVGIVLHCRANGYLGIKCRRTVGRLTKIFPDLEKRELTHSLDVIQRDILKFREVESSSLFGQLGDAASFAKRATPSEDSSFQWSELRSGITDDPEASIEKLYRRFVSLYDDEPRIARDDASVWQPVRDKLAERRLLERLEPKVIVSPIDQIEFDHAWKNGAWHCYQPLSFDLASGDNIRDKAARWSGHMTGLSKATEQVRPYFIVGAPSEANLLTDYKRAIELLRASNLEPEVFEENEAERLVELIAADMEGSHSA